MSDNYQLVWQAIEDMLAHPTPDGLDSLPQVYATLAIVDALRDLTETITRIAEVENEEGAAS